MLTVVIPALNSESTISLTLSSIFSNDFPRQMYEVLVVDNGSSDKTLEIATRYPARIIHCSKRGIGPPRNLGIKAAEGDIVCFTDSDCVVAEDWLEKIHNFFSQNTDTDGVGGPVYPYECNQNKVQRLTGELFVEDQKYPRELRKVRSGSSEGLIFGTNSAYKKDAIVSAGGYSEPGGSNLELEWRLASMGRNLFFNPEIKVRHIFPTDLKSILKQQFRWGAQSTHMQRVHRHHEGLKEKIYMPYLLMRYLLSLSFPRNLEKKIMHITQLATYDLGRISGLTT